MPSVPVDSAALPPDADAFPASAGATPSRGIGSVNGSPAGAPEASGSGARVTARRLPLLFLTACALAIALAACGPKAPPDKDGAPGPSSLDAASAAAARDLLGLGLGAGRLAWAEPEVRPGERLRWRVLAMTTADLVIEAARGEPPDDPTAGNARVERWTVTGGDGSTLVADVAQGGGALARLVVRDPGKPPVTVLDPAALRAVWSAPVLLHGTAFEAAGGRFLGNEVVRVGAGDFRARHAVIARDGYTWHLYVARSVPGGLVKLERFPAGAMQPDAVLELDDFTRLPTAPPPPPGPPPTTEAPAPETSPDPSP